MLFLAEELHARYDTAVLAVPAAVVTSYSTAVCYPHVRQHCFCLIILISAADRGTTTAVYEYVQSLETSPFCTLFCTLIFIQKIFRTTAKPVSGIVFLGCRTSLRFATFIQVYLDYNLEMSSRCQSRYDRAAVRSKHPLLCVTCK